MVAQQVIYDCISRKMQILDQIAANTSKQVRFVHKLQMKGLRRVLNERESLISELVTVNQELASYSNLQNTEELQTLLKAVNARQTEIIKVGYQALRAALEQQNSIKAKLKNLRDRRGMKQGYFNRWLPIYGNRINAKG